MISTDVEEAMTENKLPLDNTKERFHCSRDSFYDVDLSMTRAPKENKLSKKDWSLPQIVNNTSTQCAINIHIYVSVFSSISMIFPDISPKNIHTR